MLCLSVCLCVLHEDVHVSECVWGGGGLRKCELAGGGGGGGRGCLRKCELGGGG